MPQGKGTYGKQVGRPPTKHKPKESGAWNAKMGGKSPKDTHKHPHTKEVQATADYHKKGDARYKDAKSRSERTMETSPRKSTQVRMDQATRQEKRDLK
mgnify:FL=1